MVNVVPFAIVDVTRSCAVYGLPAGEGSTCAVRRCSSPAGPAVTPCGDVRRLASPGPDSELPPQAETMAAIAMPDASARV